MLVCTDIPSCTHGDYNDMLDKIKLLLISSRRRACGNVAVLWQMCRHQTHILQGVEIASGTHPELLLLLFCKAEAKGNVSNSPKGDYSKRKRVDPGDTLQPASFTFLPQSDTNGGQSRVHQNHGPIRGMQTLLAQGGSAISAWCCWGLSGETWQKML